VKTNAKRGDAVIVFNTLSWLRTQPVELEVSSPVHIVDAEGREIPSPAYDLGSPNEVNVAATGKATGKFCIQC